MKKQKKIISILVALLLVIMPLSVAAITNDSEEFNSLYNVSRICGQNGTQGNVTNEDGDLVRLQNSDIENYYENDSNSALLIDKDYLDCSDKTEKRKIKNVIQNELKHKKQIIFQGDNTNLNLDEIFLSIGEDKSFEIASDDMKDLKGVAACKNNKGETMIMLYTDSVSKDDELVGEMVQSIDDGFKQLDDTFEATQTTEIQQSSAQTRLAVSSNSGEEQTARRVGVTVHNDMVKMTVYYYWIRTAVKSDHTEWELKILIDSSPKPTTNGSYGRTGVSANVLGKGDTIIKDILPRAKGTGEQSLSFSGGEYTYFQNWNDINQFEFVHQDKKAEWYTTYKNAYTNTNKIQFYGAKLNNYIGQFSADSKVGCMIVYTPFSPYDNAIAYLAETQVLRIVTTDIKS